jgi:phosphoribosylanthranilate isomerase
MEASPRPRLKVCCIQGVEEARLAVRLGASALGLVSEMPSGPGVIGEEAIAAVACVVPPPVASFLLTSLREASAIVEQQRRTKTSTIQLCDRLPAGEHARLRAALPGIALVQVVHVSGPESVDEAAALASEVDAVLLDSGNLALPVKELGGTGRRHDWSLSRRIREVLPVPVFLAGGLGPANVHQAIAEVGPFALDVCSGVRTEGRLDAEKLGRFVAAMARARD